jgi:cyclohexyl-isocyanide hydratase
LLEGYRAASHWSVIDTLDAFGAIPTHQRVVIDRNRATGGGVTAGVDFGLTLAGMFAGEDFAKVLELGIEYNPQPPFGTGHPTIADAKTMELARAVIDDGVSTERIRHLAKGRRIAA